jgi:signal transduction histidine kinase
MTIQSRFRLLLLIFGVSVVGNALVSVWCIHIYMDEAASRWHSLTTSLQSAEQARHVLDELGLDLQQRSAQAGVADAPREERYRVLYGRVQRLIEQLPTRGDNAAPAGRLSELAASLGERCETYVDLLAEGRKGRAEQFLDEDITTASIMPMHNSLANFSQHSDEALRETSSAVYQKEATVTVILAVNAIVAFLLAATGVHLVRNWVLKPIGALKAAAAAYASGNLDYRIPDVSRDELGALSNQVNRMADSLGAIQRQLVEQERLVAVGEVTSTLAHNIRNPLASIRAMAQSMLTELPADSAHKFQLETILATVDSTNRWIRELLHVSKPIELSCRDMNLSELVTRVISILQPSARQRGSTLQLSEASAGLSARIDGPRIEQALLSVAGNAIEASPAGSVVDIRVAAQNARSVELCVVDRGQGIPEKVMKNIASPYFSTKPGGTGIGLYLARRTVQAHGGSLEFHNNAEGGTTVVLRLPRGSESHNGA